MHRVMGLGLLLTVGCARDVGEGKVAATVESDGANPGVEVSGQPEVGVRVSVDSARSEIGLVGAKITARHPIRIHDFTGGVRLVESRVTGIDFVAQVASIEADHPKLTEHLKGEDFLDVARFPTAEFTSTHVKDGAGAEGATHTVTGDLTIRGTTRRISFPATIAVEGGLVKASSEFVIDRQDFGVTYPGRSDDLIQDNVLMQVRFEAKAPQ